MSEETREMPEQPIEIHCNTHNITWRRDESSAWCVAIDPAAEAEQVERGTECAMQCMPLPIPWTEDD